MSTQVHRGAYGILTNSLGSEILLIRKARGPYQAALARPGQNVKPGADGQDSLGAQWVPLHSVTDNGISPLVSTALALLGKSPAEGR